MVVVEAVLVVVLVGGEMVVKVKGVVAIAIVVVVFV